jgi:hypothetical protein
MNGVEIKSLFGAECKAFYQFMRRNGYEFINRLCPVMYIQEFISTLGEDKRIKILQVAVNHFPQVIGFKKEL